MEPPQGRKRRRSSIDEPPDMSELMNNRIKHSDSFIEVFDSIEHRMRQIVKTFEEIADAVKQMQKRKDKVRTAGAFIGRTGFGLLILAPFFIGGASLLAAAVAVVLAGSGAAAVFISNVSKPLKEKGSAKKVEELGNEFMKLVEPLKNILEGIQMTCEKLEEKSGDQAETALMEVQKFQTSLRRVTELREKSSDTLNLALSLRQVMGILLMLMGNIFRVTATPEEDKKFTDSIIQPAEQSQRVTEEFSKMKQDFRNYQQQRELNESNREICD